MENVLIVLILLVKSVLNLMCTLLTFWKKLGCGQVLCPDFSLALGRHLSWLKLALVLNIFFSGNTVIAQSHQAELYLDHYCQASSCLQESETIRQYLTQLKDQCQTTANILVFNHNITLTVEEEQILTPDGEVWMDGSVDYLLLFEPASFTLYAQQSEQLVALDEGPLFTALQSEFSTLLPYPNKNYCAIRQFLSGLSCGAVTLPTSPCQAEPVVEEADLTFLKLDLDELDRVQETKRRLIANHCARVVIIKLPRFSPYYKEYVENRQLPPALTEQVQSRYGGELTLFLVIPDPQSLAYTLGIQHLQDDTPEATDCASQVRHIVDWLPSLENLRIPAAIAELEEMLKGGEAYQNSQLADLALVFNRDATSRYGFDTLPHLALAPNYERLHPEDNPPYYVPWQSIKLGETDAVLARRKGGGFIPPVVSFVDDSGAAIPITSSSGEKRVLEVPSALNIESTRPVYAQLPGTDEPLNIGQLNTVAYEERMLNIVVVPVNGAHAPFTSVELKNSLRAIWNQAVVDVSVTMHNGITVAGFDGELNARTNGGLSNYTPQMRDIIRAYKAVQPPQPNVYYLFLVDRHETPGKRGYMPRKKAYGFIMNSPHTSLESYAKTMAHELGHGAYVLEHIFKTYQGQLSQGSTQNLMDYSTGTDLYKYQWDLVHDPANVWSAADADEDREYIIVNNLEQLKDFRNDDGDDVFDTDDSFTFLAPSGLPITIPAGATKVVFNSGDELGGAMGVPSFDGFELMPFGTLRYFTLDSTNYNSYFEADGNYGFTGYAEKGYPSNRYYDTLTTNLPNLTNHKAIVGFPCMEEGLIFFKVGQANIAEILTAEEIANISSSSQYSALGYRKAYDFLSGVNFQDETIEMAATPYPLFTPDAENFLRRVGDAAACNSNLALYAFVHAHQISFYPGFYRSCSENFDLLTTEGMYRHKREIVQLFLDQANYDIYSPYGDLLLAEEEIQAWKSYDKSIYKTYKEHIGGQNFSTYLEGLTEPYSSETALELADYLRVWQYEICVFEELSWPHREKIIRVLSTLTLTEDNFVDNWYLVGSDEEEENLFVHIIRTTPEEDYNNLLELFEDGGNYDFYFEVIRKLHDGPNDNDTHGYEGFVTFLANAVLTMREQTTSRPVPVYDADLGRTYYCAEIPGQGCEKIISLHRFNPFTGCSADYYARFTSDNKHQLVSGINDDACFISDPSDFASVNYNVAGRPFDYVPIYLSKDVKAELLPGQTTDMEEGALYILPYCYADLLLRKIRSAQMVFFADGAVFILSVAIAPFTLGESLALRMVTLGDVAFSGANLFVFAPANYELEISGDSYLSQSILDQWQALDMIWGAANITGAIGVGGAGLFKFTLSKGRDMYNYLKSTSQFYKNSGDLVAAFRATHRLIALTSEFNNPGLISYLRAQTAAIELSRRTRFISAALDYPIKISQENFSAYFRVVDEEVQIAGGAFAGDDVFYIIPNVWDPGLPTGSTLKVADLEGMPFKDLRQGGHGNGQVVQGDLEIFYHTNHGFFFKLIGELTTLDPSLLRFRELFNEIKAWNWSEFEGDFADWVLALNTAQRDELYKSLKAWPAGANGETLFDGLKADLFTNPLPDGLANADLRAFLEADMERLIGWEIVSSGPYRAKLSAIEFFSNRKVLQSRFKVINQGIAAAHPDIPVEELTAIYHYTDGLDNSLNSALREGNLSPFYQCFEDLLNTVLSKITPYEGEVLYRGAYGAEGEIAKTWSVGEEIGFQDFKSCSSDVVVANGFAVDNGGDVVYEITNPLAYDVTNMSFFPQESEVLFKSNSRFRVVHTEADVEIVHKGNTHLVTKVYLEFFQNPLDASGLYGIFRSKFLTQGATESAAHQLAEQTAQLFQSKGWGLQELTDELANVLVHADDGSPAILSRLSAWETPQLNNFLDDLASEQGAVLVAFLGENPEGVRAWEVLSFSSEKRASLGFLQSLLNIQSRVSYNDFNHWDAIINAFQNLTNTQKAKLVDEIRLCDEFYDNSDEFLLTFIKEPETDLKPFLNGSDLRGRGSLDLDEPDFLLQYGPGVTIEEFHQQSIETIQQYIDLSKPSHAFLFGLDESINLGVLFPQQPGILDIHIHGQYDITAGDYKFFFYHDERSWHIADAGVWLGAEELADIIMSSSEFSDINAIRLFACCGEQSGAKRIAEITGKPVLGANFIISVADNGDMHLNYGKLELYE
ncbi:MAG: hypothetical protein DHS20C18_24880 [Saprospiraceae bacterium]|nr:MAG: hypothetical protein DHS20C18_24880 [Saprospiraceae bacterium]